MSLSRTCSVFLLLVAAASTPSASGQTLVEVHRAVRAGATFQDHLLTSHAPEYAAATTGAGLYAGEGPRFRVSSTTFAGAVRVVRMRRPDGQHDVRLLTIDGSVEQQQARTAGYVDDGALGFVFASDPGLPGVMPLLRSWKAAIGDRLYTLDAAEHQATINDGYVVEARLGFGWTLAAAPPTAAPDGARSTISASPTSGVLADGVQASTITVVVRDATGAALAGWTVDLAVSGAGAALDATRVTSDAQGRATAGLRAASAGTKSVTATIDPASRRIAVSGSASVDFTAGAPPSALTSRIVAARFVRCENEDRAGAGTFTTPLGTPLPRTVVDLVQSPSTPFRRYRELELELRTDGAGAGAVHRVRVQRPDGTLATVAQGGPTTASTRADDFLPGTNTIIYDCSANGVWSAAANLSIMVYDFPKLHAPFRGRWRTGHGGNAYNEDTHQDYVRTKDGLTIDLNQVDPVTPRADDDYFAPLFCPFERARVSFRDTTGDAWYGGWGKSAYLTPIGPGPQNEPVRDLAGREYKLGLCHQAVLTVAPGDIVTLGQLVGACGATGDGQHLRWSPHLHLALYVVEGDTFLSVLPEPLFLDPAGRGVTNLDQDQYLDSALPQPASDQMIVDPDAVPGTTERLVYGWGRKKHHTSTVAGNPTVTCTWTPPTAGLAAGYHRAEALVSIYNSSTRSARYTLEDADGTRTVVVDQNALVNDWAPLASMRYQPGSPFRVTLTNTTSDPGTEITFDAVRFVRAASAAGGGGGGGGGGSPWAGWTLEDHQQVASATIESTSTSPGGGLSVRLTVSRPVNSFEVQWKRPGLAVQLGERYRVAFELRAEARRDVAIELMQESAPWTNLGLRELLPVDTAWQHVERTFIATGSETDGRLTLQLGAETPAVLLADVVFEHVAAGMPGPSPSPPSPPSSSPTPPVSNGQPASGGGGGGGGCSLGRAAPGSSWSGALALALVALALCRARRYRV